MVFFFVVLWLKMLRIRIGKKFDVVRLKVKVMIWVIKFGGLMLK